MIQTYRTYYPTGLAPEKESYDDLQSSLDKGDQLQLHLYNTDYILNEMMRFETYSSVNYPPPSILTIYEVATNTRGVVAWVNGEGKFLGFKDASTGADYTGGSSGGTSSREGTSGESSNGVTGTGCKGKYGGYTSNEVIVEAIKPRDYRPDKDMKLTCAEAISWAIFGKNICEKDGLPMDLDVNINTIDLSQITSKDFGNKIGKKQYFNLSGKYFSNIDDALVYGNIQLEYLGNGKVKGFYDTYDTDLRFANGSWYKEAFRNIGTLGLEVCLWSYSLKYGYYGQFNSYNINIHGTTTIKVEK